MINKISSAYKSQFRITDSITLDSGVKVPCITGQVGQVGVVSQNGYRYKEDFWTKILGQASNQELINDHRMLGMIEHPTDDDEFLATPYDKASHIVLKAWVQDGQPYATFGLLNNPQGNAIKALTDVGFKPGVSTRGMGQFGNDQISQYVDDKDYMLITWDIVKTPNFSELSMSPVTDSLMSHPLFKELCQAHQLKDSSFEGYNQQALISDMGKMISELNAKWNLLTSHMH